MTITSQVPSGPQEESSECADVQPEAAALGNSVFLLVLHEPYSRIGGAPEVNATIVHGRTLLHPYIPQPDGGMVFRCLTEVPRARSSVVPMSTLTYELANGRLWPYVANPRVVKEAIVSLTKLGGCSALRLTLPAAQVDLLAKSPIAIFRGRRHWFTPAERQGLLRRLARDVAQVCRAGEFWPGDNLVDPRAQPPAMPYSPGNHDVLDLGGSDTPESSCHVEPGSHQCAAGVCDR